MDQEKTADGRLLFDGKCTHGWRGIKMPGVPDGCRAVDGALVSESRGGDRITVEPFDNFERVFEWKIAPGAHSGVNDRIS